MAAAVDPKFACMLCGFASDSQDDLFHGPGGAKCGPLLPVKNTAKPKAELVEEAANHPVSIRMASETLRARWREKHGRVPRGVQIEVKRLPGGRVRLVLRGRVSLPNP